MGRFIVPEGTDVEILSASIANLKLALEDAKAGRPRVQYQHLLAFASHGIDKLRENGNG